MSEEKEKIPYYDNKGVNEYLNNLFDELLIVRQSIRNREDERESIPKLKGLLILLGRSIELEIASGIKVW